MAISILRVEIDFTLGHLNPLYQVQGLGFSGEIGYQSFLYPSEREVHPLYMFSLKLQIHAMNDWSTSKLYKSILMMLLFYTFMHLKSIQLILAGSKPPAFPHWKVASSWGGDCGRHWAADCPCQEKDRASHTPKAGRQEGDLPLQRSKYNFFRYLGPRSSSPASHFVAA